MFCYFFRIDEETSTVVNDFITITGEGGSGKSFLTRVLAKMFFEKDIICFFIDLSAMQTNDSTNFYRFLLENSCYDIFIDKDQINGLNKWLSKNQSRVVIILDGLDRMSNTHLCTDFIVSLDKKQSSKQWVSAILARKVLSNSKVILTSRPWAVCSLDGEYTTDYSLSLDGFSAEDIRTVLELYVDKSEANALFKSFTDNKIVELAKNPSCTFMLIEIARDKLKVDTDDITRTYLYNRVFEKRLSKSNRRTTDETINKIERLCYKLTLDKKFIIEDVDLIKGVKFEDIENTLPVSVKSHSAAYYSVNRKLIMEVNHQLWQVCTIKSK